MGICGMVSSDNIAVQAEQGPPKQANAPSRGLSGQSFPVQTSPPPCSFFTWHIPNRRATNCVTGGELHPSPTQHVSLPVHLMLRNIAQVGLHGAHDANRELLQHQVLQVHGMLKSEFWNKDGRHRGQGTEKTQFIEVQPCRACICTAADQMARLSALSCHVLDWPQR